LHCIGRKISPGPPRQVFNAGRKGFVPGLPAFVRAFPT
jgi:hypothetical protein